MKKAIIHIGGHKTGSTAIQSFCVSNAAYLQQINVVYPLELLTNINVDGLQAHHGLVNFFMNHNSFWNTIDLSPNNIADMGSYLRALPRDKNILLSSENLTWLDEEAINKLKNLLDGYDVYVVIYARRQDNALQALYQTTILHDYTTQTFNQYVECSRVLFDYYKIAKNWQSVFDNGTIVVRVYENNQLQNDDVVSDFVHVLGNIIQTKIDTSYCIYNKSYIANRGVPEHVISLVAYYNNLDSENTIVPIIKTIANFLYQDIKGNYELILPSERKALLKSFYSSNKLLAQEFLGREDGVLFKNLEIQQTDDEWNKKHDPNGNGLDLFLHDFMNYLFTVNDKKENYVESNECVLNYQGLHNVAKDLPIDDWIELVGKSTDQKISLMGVPLPSFPPAEKQAIFHGSSGSVAINGAAPVYKYVLQVCQQQGINPIKSLLDFGCGWGRFTRLFVRDVEEAGLIGIDPWDEALQMCREHMPYAAFVRSQFDPPLAFRDEFFDVIFANSIFSHLSEFSALSWIKEITRILRPGGLLIATTHSKHWLVAAKEFQKEERICENTWHEGFKNSTVDFSKAIESHRNGTFIFAPTASNIDNPHYGDSFVPEQYIKDVWSEFLELVDFIDDPSRFPQATFTLRKKSSTTFSVNFDDSQADIFRDRALVAIEKNDWQSALDDLRMAYAIRPHGPYIRLQLVNVLVQLKHFTEVNSEHLDFLNNPPDYVLNNEWLNNLCNQIRLALSPIECENNSLSSQKSWSCDQLESNIVVLPGQIAFCCYPIPASLKRPSMAENIIFDESFSFDADIYQSTKKTIIEKNQTDEPHCKDCSYLKFADWSHKKNVEILRLAPSYKCNFACTYCPQPHEQAKTLFPLSIIEQLKNQGLLSKNFLVELSGGEPTLLQNFADACSLITDNNFRLFVVTNGTVFVPELHEALKGNLARVTISLDAGTNETFQLLKKTKLFKKVCTNVAKYSEGNTNVVLKYVLMDVNKTHTEIEKFVQIASTTGVGVIHVGFDAYSNKVPSDDIILAAAYMFDTAKKFDVECVFSDLSLDRDKERVFKLLES